MAQSDVNLGFASRITKLEDSNELKTRWLLLITIGVAYLVVNTPPILLQGLMKALGA